MDAWMEHGWIMDAWMRVRLTNGPYQPGAGHARVHLVHQEIMNSEQRNHEQGTE